MSKKDKKVYLSKDQNGRPRILVNPEGLDPNIPCRQVSASELKQLIQRPMSHPDWDASVVRLEKKSRSTCWVLAVAAAVVIAAAVLFLSL